MLGRFSLKCYCQFNILIKLLTANLVAETPVSMRGEKWLSVPVWDIVCNISPEHKVIQDE